MNLLNWEATQALGWKLNERYAGVERIGISNRYYFAASFLNSSGSEIVAVGVALDERVSEEKAFSEAIERITAMEVMDVGSSNSVCKQSVTNGFAAHPNLKEAITRAKLELVERDSVLRSWYGLTSGPIALKSVYDTDIDGYLGGAAVLASTEVDADTITTVVYFLNPLGKGIPFIYGFGSAFTLKDAISAAKNEALQRYIFIKDESPEAKELIPVPSAAFHQDYFLQKQNSDLIYDWIYSGSPNNIPQVVIETPTLFKIHRKEPVHVVQALNSGCLELFFGSYDYPKGSHYKARGAYHPVP